MMSDVELSLLLRKSHWINFAQTGSKIRISNLMLNSVDTSKLKSKVIQARSNTKKEQKMRKIRITLSIILTLILPSSFGWRVE